MKRRVLATVVQIKLQRMEDVCRVQENAQKVSYYHDAHYCEVILGAYLDLVRLSTLSEFTDQYVMLTEIHYREGHIIYSFMEWC